MPHCIQIIFKLFFSKLTFFKQQHNIIYIFLKRHTNEKKGQSELIFIRLDF